jgi:hypothetical protein
MAGHDLARGLDAIHPGHHQIHEDDVRLEGLRLGQGFGPVAGFAHYLHVRLGGQQGADPLAQDGMVVGQKHSNRCCHLASPPLGTSTVMMVP